MKIEYLKLLLKDALNISEVIHNNRAHLNSAIEWIKRAQSVTCDGGVSTRYSIFKGWRVSYPETTGYIIPTLSEYYSLSNDSEILNRIQRMADWLVGIQLDNGGFKGGPLDTHYSPLIFDTGQILQGLVCAYTHFNHERYLEAAINAGNFLMDSLDDDGAWRKYSHNGIPHSYHSRVAWALLELYQATKNTNYLSSGLQALDYVLTLQKENGWFKNCAFSKGVRPLTHTIAYTVRGLLESGLIANKMQYVNAALKTAEVVVNIFEAKNVLKASYNHDWITTDLHQCLTGNAQFAVIWFRIYDRYKKEKFLHAAKRINHSLKRTQLLNARSDGIRGGIKGSQPIFGNYGRFAFLNWSTKFFADALLLEERLS